MYAPQAKALVRKAGMLNRRAEDAWVERSCSTIGERGF